MEIRDKRESVKTVKEIEDGRCFTNNGHTFIKTQGRDTLGDCECVDLMTGQVIIFSRIQVVESINASVVIE